MEEKTMNKIKQKQIIQGISKSDTHICVKNINELMLLCDCLEQEKNFILVYIDEIEGIKQNISEYIIVSNIASKIENGDIQIKASEVLQ